MVNDVELVLGTVVLEKQAVAEGGVSGKSGMSLLCPRQNLSAPVQGFLCSRTGCISAGRLQHGLLIIGLNDSMVLIGKSRMSPDLRFKSSSVKI